jgi:hypothetical protein
MNSDQFIDAIDSELRPTLEPLGYRVSTMVSGRSYDAECATEDHVAIVSFEPGDSFLLIAVLAVRDGVRSSLDDREASPRLGDLNRRLLGPLEIESLERDRTALPTLDPERARLVSALRQLRLVLPKYAAERRGAENRHPHA